MARDERLAAEPKREGATVLVPLPAKRVGACLAVALLAAFPAVGCGRGQSVLPHPDIGGAPAIVGAPLYPGSTLRYKQGFDGDEPVWIDGHYYSMVVLSSEDGVDTVVDWYAERLTTAPGFRETRASGGKVASIAITDPAVFINMEAEDGYTSIAITREVSGPGEPLD